jgi:tetratricopeptide (TPR) repeat protein
MNMSNQSNIDAILKRDFNEKPGLALTFFLLTMMIAVVPVIGRADQSDNRLITLFARLKTTPDPMEAQRIESDIWQIWIDSGREDMNAVVEQGIRAMGRGRYAEAISVFNRVVTELPEFAEGWNKRATVHYLNGDFTASVIDIERTLELEPRHFGAISGMGLIFMARGDDTGALRAFEEVLEIHPHARAAQIHVEALRRKLKSQGA